MKMLDRMYVWLVELGYDVWLVGFGNDVHQNVPTGLHIWWEYPKPMNENEHSKTKYLTPLRATDTKKYSDEHSKKELTLKEILDKVSELADVGIYRHTFPLVSFCEHNIIRQSTVDRLRELGYNVCVKNNKLEVRWSKIGTNKKNDKFLLTAWDALLRADIHNFQVVEQIERVLNVIHDKSINEGLFEYITYVSCPETCAKLRELGYKVTELQGDKIKIYWGE